MRAVSNLKQYAVSLVLLVFAALISLVGILAVTVWKPAQYVVASGESSQPFVMTRTGVLPLYNQTVTVTVTAVDPAQKVWMAIGSSHDIKGWLGDLPYDEVIGLEDLKTLKFLSHGDSEGQAQSGDSQSGDSQSGGGQPEEAAPAGAAVEGAQSGSTAPDVDLLPEDAPVPTSADRSEEVDSGPIASDMWLSLREGRGTIEIELLPSYADASLLIASDGDIAAPKLTLTWSYPQPNLLAWTAFTLAAAVLLLAGLTAWTTQRRQVKRKARAERILVARQADVTETAAMPAITEDVLPDIAEATPAPVEEVQPKKVERSSILSDERFAPEGPVGDATEDSAEPEPSEETAEELGSAPVEDPAQIPAEPSAHMESISTDSGMINLSALQGGAAFPTRRALREAQARGVQSLIVEGREFHTGSTPVVAAKDEADGSPTASGASDVARDAVSEVLGKRSTRVSGWGRAFTNQKRSADEANNQTAESEGDEDE